MRRFLVALITGYQRLISPWLGPRCRFYPSCSEWTKQAVEAHGILQGVGLGLSRLLRCHPFHPGGYDPFPQSEPP